MTVQNIWISVSIIYTALFKDVTQATTHLFDDA